MAADAQDVNIGVAAAELDGDAMAQQAENGCCSCLPSASWIGYCTLSALAAVLAVYHAFDSRDSMYSALVFLSTSKVSLTIVANFGLMVLASCVMTAAWLFLGKTHWDELERVWSAARMMVVEVLFSLTVFREELTIWTMYRFALLLAAKYIHELLDARMDNMERRGMEGWGKHARFTAGLLSFALLDVMVASMYGVGAMDGRPSVSILFAFEHAVLALTVLLTSVRYALWCVEQRMGREWRARTAYFAWWSLFVHAVRLGINIVYVWIIYTSYGMPLLMFRELLHSWNAVQRELASIIAARRIRKLIDERFHKLRDHEIAAMDDKTCTCCFNDLDAEDYGPCVRLPCNHSFHTDCLLGWFDHGEGCPVCRLDLFSEEADRMLQAQRRQQRADREERQGGRGRVRRGEAAGAAPANDADAATGSNADDSAPRARASGSGRRDSSARDRSASGEERDGTQRVRRRKRRLQRRRSERGDDTEDDQEETAAEETARNGVKDETAAVRAPASPSPAAAGHRSTPKTSSSSKGRRRAGIDKPQAPAMSTPIPAPMPMPMPMPGGQPVAMGGMQSIVSPQGAATMTPPATGSPGGTEAQAAAWIQYQQWQQYQMYMQAQQYQQWQQWAMYQQQIAAAGGASPPHMMPPPGTPPPVPPVSPGASGMPYPPAYSPFQQMAMPSGLGSPATPQAHTAVMHAPGSGTSLPTATPAAPAAAWPQSAAIAAALSTPVSAADESVIEPEGLVAPEANQITATQSSGSVGSDGGPSREEQRLARLRSLGQSE